MPRYLAMEDQAQLYENIIASCPKDEKLKNARKAAELYLEAARHAPPGSERRRLMTRCQSLLDLAESLKTKQTSRLPHTTPNYAGSTNRSQQSHCVSRRLTPRERAIITLSSKLHGNTFKPWEGAPDDSEFKLYSLNDYYIDESKYSLSVDQLHSMSGWKRPHEIFQTKLGHEYPRVINMAVDDTVDLAQDVTTDCSVVASLSSALRIMSSGHESILRGMIYPFDVDRGIPKASDNGKYIFRFYFNGCYRQVAIDDRLPASDTDCALFAVDLKNPTSIWPALIEKAYLKVRGGYDFPGSNSCIDLWTITGWIPEQIFLQKEDHDLNDIWNILRHGFHKNEVILTLGTGPMSESEEQATGLVAEHDYGVLDLKDDTHERRLLIKNPWCVGPAWASIKKSDAYTTVQFRSTESRVFWITLEFVAQYFESMYLNWSPSRFKCRQDHHFTWNVHSRYNVSGTVHQNPQYQIYSSQETLAWIVLDRHHRDEELDLVRARASNSRESSLGYMSLAIIEDGCRILKLSNLRSTVDFVDSNQTLAKVLLVPGNRYTVIPLQDNLPLPAYSFTLSLFTNSDIEVKDAPNRYPYQYTKEASWGRRTAGGNPSFPSYGISPQFQFTLTRTADMSFLLASDVSDIPVHLDVVWTNPGERVGFPLARRVVVADSKEYIRRSAIIRHANLNTGTYNIVCSTFQSNQFAGFSLLVETNVEIDLVSLPNLNAGRLPQSLPCLVFPKGVGRVRIAINSQRLAHAMVMMQEDPILDLRLGPTISSSYRISVCYGWGSTQNEIAASSNGAFEENISILKTSDFDIEPARVVESGFWIVVERIGDRSSSEAVQLQVYSDRALQIGTWEDRD